LKTQSNIALILLTFDHALKNCQKLANFHLQLLQKLTVFHKGLLSHKLLVLTKFYLIKDQNFSLHKNIAVTEKRQPRGGGIKYFEAVKFDFYCHFSIEITEKKII
jgi:hypothetical protein